MRSLAALLLCGAALAQERAFVEVTATKHACYAGERVRLTLRFGYDREFFRTNAVRLFARELDVPVQVQARLPGERGANARGPRFALNDGVAEATSTAEDVREGRAFTIVEMTHAYAPPEPGEIAIPAPTLRYAHATEFEEDFVMGRVAKDPKQEVVSGAPLELRVLPLPEEGRPPGFEGAVGRFTVRAEADRASVDEGGILVLTLTIEGEGNAAAPRLGLPGFHVYGTSDPGGHGGRTTRYDIAPLSAGVKEIPAIAFAFFDPGPPAGYRVVRTEPIPLEVRGRATDAPPPPPPAPAGDGASTIVLVAAGLLAVAVAGLLAWHHRRSGGDRPPDPEALRLRGALAALRARSAGGGPDLADAFADFLAAYLKCPPAAVIGPGLAARLAAAGFPDGLALRAAATLERLVAARYGAKGAAAEDLASLLPEIEAALPPAR